MEKLTTNFPLFLSFFLLVAFIRYSLLERVVLYCECARVLISSDLLCYNENFIRFPATFVSDFILKFDYISLPVPRLRVLFARLETCQRFVIFP